jgi:hypothetical protein
VSINCQKNQKQGENFFTLNISIRRVIVYLGYGKNLPIPTGTLKRDIFAPSEWRRPLFLSSTGWEATPSFRSPVRGPRHQTFEPNSSLLADVTNSETQKSSGLNKFFIIIIQPLFLMTL